MSQQSDIASVPNIGSGEQAGLNPVQAEQLQREAMHAATTSTPHIRTAGAGTVPAAIGQHEVPTVRRAIFGWRHDRLFVLLELAKFLPIVAAASFLLSTILVSWAITWTDWSTELKWNDARFFVAALAGAFGICAAICGRRCDQAVNNTRDSAVEVCKLCGAVSTAHEQRELRNDAIYNRYLVGLGYALLLCGVANVIGLAGLSWRGSLQSLIDGTVSSAADGPARLARHQVCAVRILLTANMAVLGAVFFVTNALRKKRQCKEGFDKGRFWGGLWYRVGEAVLFTVVFYLVLHRFVPDSAKASVPSDPPKEVDLWMPILGLLVGMFIQSGERLVYGIAQRAFAAVSALLPLGTDDLSQNAGDQVGSPLSTSAAAAGRSAMTTTPPRSSAKPKH